MSITCLKQFNLYICKLKIYKTICYVCNRRDSRATVQS